MRDNEAKYLKLYEALRDEIIGGAWPCGMRLPSRRQIASERGLSVITVEHSYELLCQEGYAEARARSGYYVTYRESDGFAAPEGSPRVHVSADAQTTTARNGGPTASTRDGAPFEGGGTGEDGFPFSVLARAMRKVLADYGEAILDKAPNTGCESLRGALSGYLARNRGIHARPEQIVIGSGAEYLYGLVVEMLGGGRVFGIESPSYEKIEQVYRARGVECELLPLGRDGIRTAALRQTRASVLHITPFRSFPSGVTASASKRAEYLRWASKVERYIVEDDFESEFSLLRKPEETVYARSERGNVLYMNTFSRTISSALRVGYMVLPEELLPLFGRRVGFYSCAVPTFEQLVLAELIDSGDFERHINRIRRAKRRALERTQGEG